MVYLIIWWNGKKEHKTFSDTKEVNQYWVKHKGDIRRLKREI